jgi:hypothetical protein
MHHNEDTVNNKTAKCEENSIQVFAESNRAFQEIALENYKFSRRENISMRSALIFMW